MDEIVLITVAAAFFCGGVVKGVVGIGLPLTSIALMTTVIDLRLAIPLLVVPILATNIVQAFRGGRFLELIRQYWLMLVTAAIGVYAGTAALYSVELSYLLTMLGVVVAAYSLMNLTSFRLNTSEKNIPIWSPIVGFLSGGLAGTTGSIGVPVIIYYQALKMLGVESTLVRVPGEPHGIRRRPSHWMAKLENILGSFAKSPRPAA